MAVNYLHGVETTETDKGPRPVRVVKTAVTFIVGTAPMGPINTPTLILNDKDASQFGPTNLSGFTLPRALDGHIDQGAGTIIAINVLDPTTHKASVTNESFTLDAYGKAKLAHGALANVVIKNSGATVTYVKDTDYSIDLMSGEIQRISTGAMVALSANKASYDYADPTAVVAADVNGTVTNGVRTGIKLGEDCFNLFGFHPKILIAPVFSTQSSVSAELAILTPKVRGVALVDAPIGTTPTQAITGRGPSGAINFSTSSDRVVLCYPHLKVYDEATNGTRLEPYSIRFAGVICRTDVDKGYWNSPSNQEILGVLGMERSISFRVNDPSTEANALNEAGITTVANSFGTGFRTWGNRSAAWPTVTHPKNFIAVRRTADVIAESIEFSSLQFSDMPINQAFIDSVLGTANGFMRTLVARGAIIDGIVYYDKAKNPPEELASGHIVFNYSFMPPIPAERITYESFVDINMLAQLTGSQS